LEETNEYDEIFAALKHPIRRQILLLLEQKGEASFTDIQNAVGINDTGLMSYHLKELAPLIEQSARGKYSLSEVGRTSVELFRTVERERQRSSTAVRRELEKSIGEAFFLLLIVGFTLIAPLSVDVSISVYAPNLSLTEMVGLYSAGLSGMLFGAVMFAFYDRHYFSKRTKTAVIHSTIFAVVLSLLSIYPAYVNRGFQEILALPSNSDVTWLFTILRAVSFLVGAPLVTFGISELMKRH